MSVKSYLRDILKTDVSEDIVQYIESIQQEDDYNEFMEGVIDDKNAVHVENLKQFLFGKKSQNIKKQPSKQNNKNNSNGERAGQGNTNTNNSNNQNKGKKAKYVNFYGQDNKAGLRKGRCPCDCQASKHDLINNCTNCGRIVCEQEGSGPCLFCDYMVCTREELQVLSSEGKESSRLYNQLMDQKKSKEFKKAIDNRNRLIMTDQSGSSKNKVFDDQNDYFDANSSWINDEEKVTIRRKTRSAYEQLHRRRDLKLALDFASRTVSVETDSLKKQKQHLMKGVNKLLDQTETRFPKNLFEGDKAELITEIVKLMEQTSITSSKNNVQKSVKSQSEDSQPTRRYRIANSDFLESVDQGMCLSMHQPWASLLVSGIKIHEGRTWKTEHRGRLWIAAAAKEPEDEEILACEEMYRALYNDPTLEFPKKYPTGCLLGCVVVEDCMEQKDYRQIFPDGESSSPYVFICSTPVVLPIFYPMQGQHKIFQLSKDLHKTAKAALMSSKWM